MKKEFELKFGINYNVEVGERQKKHHEQTRKQVTLKDVWDTCTLNKIINYGIENGKCNKCDVEHLNNKVMINAHEAKQRTKKTNQDNAKILPILGNINGQIISACDKGKNNLFISDTQFEGLSVEQMNIIMSKIKCLGYNVNPIYEDTRAGYEVIW